MPLNLVQAGAAAGRSKSSILRAIKRGALSASRDDTTGGWCIEESELFRAFPRGTNETGNGTSRNRPAPTTIRELEARIAEMIEAQRLRDETIADLRRRLDVADEERRNEAEERRRLTATLADQRVAPARPWWRRVVGR